MTGWLAILLSGLVGGVMGTAVTALFTWRSTWASYADVANKLALDVDRLFISHSEFRPYFYDKVPLTSEGCSDYSRALATREFVADSLEGICDNRDAYSREDWASWLDYVNAMLKTSPTLRELLEEKKDEWYPSMWGRADPPPSFPRTRKFWHDTIGR
jgi:hypothetical protein